MDSEYPFGIFKLFLQEHKLKITMKYGWVQYPYLADMDRLFVFPCWWGGDGYKYVLHADTCDDYILNKF